ncbi:MAG TPA: alpha/beta hydrolase [Caulobacteraceae bacterium]|jgi:acetyl esterase/lipase
MDDAGATIREVIELWPDGPPTKGPDLVELSERPLFPTGDTVGRLRNVSNPTITVYRPATANGVGVIVAPGGGWRVVMWEHEGSSVAEWLAERGYTAFLLKYRVAPTTPDLERYEAESLAMMTALSAPRAAAKAARHIDEILKDETTRLGRELQVEDGRRALRLVRERAAEFGVDPGKIGMIGFSAGAFLCVDVALAEPGLAFIAPIYGGDVAGRPIPADAPPLFTCLALDDHLLFRIVEGAYYDWSNADRPAEIHVFRRGAHGFGMLKQGFPSDGWIDLFGAFMADLGLK